jgi:NTP pyrophosphatase (non-canonical NTP hydrolase)
MGLLKKIQKEHFKWAEHNFPNRKPHQPLLGAGEELGELYHAHLKEEQDIRHVTDRKAEKEDAVADIIIFLIDYCNQSDIDMENVLKNTWKEVKKRDWKNDPKGGKNKNV